jgi:hypothetical protein
MKTRRMASRAGSLCMTAMEYDRAIEETCSLCGGGRCEPAVLNCAPPGFVWYSGNAYRRIRALVCPSELLVRPGDCGNVARKAPL